MTQKAFIVVMSPYAVPDHLGRHLTPGTVSEVELTEEVQAHIAAGRFSVLPVRETPPEPEPALKPSAKARPVRDSDTLPTEEP